MRNTKLVTFTEGEDFYLYHHIEVLGEAEGCLRCAHQMSKEPRHILDRYRLLKSQQKEKTRQIAV
ncbi:hypothetical protein E2L07_05610 [Halalkalibacterium halodurans]|uniref:hypothetical protein n=1 Tax=Halalkalibacterium halodurans TaxID=86665 RepID=UPI001068B802|nr:hypothetical protein [Halalkalibacterium halodurans]TES56163.1 hypothetical protein E2L07_05610 [Halalkalibacterium halodurans]